MSEVTRYDLNVDDLRDVHMKACERGSYLEYEDYAALEAEMSRLQAAVNNGVAVRFQPDTDTYIAHDDGPYLVVRAALEEGGDG